VPVEEQSVVSSILRAFPEDVTDHLEHRCRRRHDIVLPRISNLEDGAVAYDPSPLHQPPERR
jgi:hypothetical protein